LLTVVLTASRASKMVEPMVAPIVGPTWAPDRVQILGRMPVLKQPSAIQDSEPAGLPLQTPAQQPARG